MTGTGCQVPTERAEDIRQDINASTTPSVSLANTSFSFNSQL